MSSAAPSRARPGTARPEVTRRGRRGVGAAAAATARGDDADDTPRSALQALREDGARAQPAVLAALRQAGDLDGEVGRDLDGDADE
jgi:hypothetical protein